ncbi:MAG: hypothetical protein Q7T30_02910 [Planctomycetota bacterium]|nr:hypothetical protein [Planctomycetota bacterium]
MPRPHLRTALCLLGGALPAQVADWHRMPVFAGSSTMALAFDSRRERTVLFEGNGWGDVARTWEWVGAAWSLRRTTATPPPRAGFGLTWDPWRQRVVLFGGTTHHMYWLPGVLLADTWEYDGGDWQRRTPANSPPPQLVAWLGPDFANNRLLLCSLSPQPGAGTWHYDGATWTASATVPFPSNQAGLGSDPVRQRIVAVSVGTIWGQFPTNTTFEWDGNAWTQLVPAQNAPLGLHMAYVPSRGTCVLAAAGALWEWNGITWGTIATAPPPPLGYLAYDTTRGRLISVGTFANPNAHRYATAEWDGATWHSGAETETPNTEAETTWFDGNRGRVVAFPRTEPAWYEWDGAEWLRQRLPPGAGGSFVAFDAARNRAVALQWSLATNWTTVEWDGTNWSPPILASPPWRSPLVYHAGRGRVMTVCGASGLWEWDGLAWNALGPTTSAPWLSSNWFDLAYDATRNELVACTFELTSPPSTSTWNGITWTQHTPAATPTARIEFSLEYDPLRQRVVMFGGRNLLGPNSTWIHHGDLWEWDGASWSQRLLPHSPPARIAPALVFDPTRQELLMSGGMRIDPSTPLRFRDAWTLAADPAAMVVQLGPGCAATPFPPELLVSHPHPDAPAFTVDLTGALPSVPALFAFAFVGHRTALAGTCTSHVPNPVHLVFAVSNASGFASTHAAIPLAMLGTSFTVQAAALDPGSPLGVALTPGLRITIGR